MRRTPVALPRRSVALPVAVAVAVAVVLGAWLTAMRMAGADSALGQWISNAGLLAVTLPAGTSCLVRSRSAGAARRAWVLLGLSALSWGGGQAVWTVYESVHGREVPFPSAADAGYLLAVVLMTAGLLALPSTSAALSTRLRLVLDGVLVALSLAMLSWEVVLADTLEEGGDSLAAAISLAYLVGDVICGTVALVALARARHGTRVPVPTLLLLCAGPVAFAVGDSGFTYLTLHDRYYSGHPIDAGWFLGFALLGLAALVPAQSEQRSQARHEHGTSAGLVAPYVAVVAAIGAGVVRLTTLGRLGPFLAWGTLTLVALLVVPLVLALQENTRLTRGLEARVEERTAELAGQERWFRSLMQNLSDVVTVVDEDGTVTYATPSSAQHFGRSPDELVGCRLRDWWTTHDAARLQPLFAELSARPGTTRVFDGEVRHADGRTVPVEATVTSLGAEQAVRGFVLNVRDVTERRGLERELAHQAFHDALTGLANRALFSDRVGRSLARRARSNRGVSVLFLDLDGFKAVNDTIGHAAGDRLLQVVAQRLTGCVRPADTVARLGGDEFAVLLEDLGPGEDGSDVAVRIADALRAPVDLDGREVRIGCSCGIAQHAAAESADELLRNADLAMYRAKADNSGGYAVFEPEMHADLVTRLELEEDLRSALDRGEFEVWYQPTVSLSDARWVGCEALLRWRHPTRGLVPPAEFISVAEETGLIVELGTWVLHQACQQAAEWRRTRPEVLGLGVAVNVSPHQLRAPGLLETVDAALRLAGIPASLLTIELTESVLVEHTEQMRDLLAALKARGVRLAIDDFGTGYSSLSYLHRFPVDVLKVDRSFVSGMASGSDEEELTRTIVRLGHSLGLTVIAEGIEDEGEMQSLQDMSCDLGQGYLFSQPVPAERVAELAWTAFPRPTPRALRPELQAVG